MGPEPEVDAIGMEHMATYGQQPENIIFIFRELREADRTVIGRLGVDPIARDGVGEGGERGDDGRVKAARKGHGAADGGHILGDDSAKVDGEEADEEEDEEEDCEDEGEILSSFRRKRRQ